MTTISERLRDPELLHGIPRKVKVCADAANLIDALGAALEETLAIAERNERGDFGDRARAALALARKGGK